MKAKEVRLNVLLTGALLVFAAAAAFSAEESAVATAKVPFAFTAGMSSLPAGDYTIFRAASGVTIRIKDDNGHALIALCSTKVAGGDSKRQLVFHRYGDSYFLSEVQLGPNSDGVSLRTSKLEKEQMNSASKSVAGASRPPEVVLVAASTRN
jgi:hypothetical protein